MSSARGATATATGGRSRRTATRLSTALAILITLVIRHFSQADASPNPGPSVTGSGPARVAGVPCGIFVATTGTHDAGCGLSRDSPCRTVQEGIDRAVAEGATCVNVQAGVYTQTISLAAGVSVIGGFDVNWQPGPYTTAGHVTEIRGVANAVDGQSQAVVARNLTPAPVLTNLVLTAPNASGFMTGTNSGKSSYVVHVFGGNLVMRNCRLNCGNGASGTAGTGGTDAISVLRNLAMNGQGGGNGASSAEFCNDTSRGALGLKGQNGSCASANGGDGGRGGTMDSDCTIPRDFNANVGENGNPATTVLGTAGLGSPGSAQCANANAGNPGRIQNGAAGAGGGVTLDVIGAPAYLRGRAGAAAGGGLFGGGGGGGGGEGGCDAGIDTWGAGGGGGGAGGCQALAGGGGGGAGGGSYGLVLVVAHADVADLDIVRGNGGSGGSGGQGGRGQQGGLAGIAGTGPDGGRAGAGGIGAHGGHGGGGGGGAGGASAGIVRCSNTTLVSANLLISGGTTGTGGAGGVSAPATTGTSEDDGNDGTAGASGAVQTTLANLTCSQGQLPNLAWTSCDLNTGCGVVDVPGGGSQPVLTFAGLAPNPTRGGGRFQFMLPRSGRVRLGLYDVAGHLRRMLVDATRDAGTQTIAWDGLDRAGRRIPTGAYLARLEFGAEERIERVVVVR